MRNEPIRRLNERHGYVLRPGVVVLHELARRHRVDGGRRLTRRGDLQGSLHLPLRVAVGDRAPLVALVLAAAERDLELHLAVLEVELRGDERQALLAHLGVEAVDLAPLEQQLAVAIGDVVRDVALGVLGDRGADEPHLAVAHVGERLAELDVARAQRLHLGAAEHDPRLDALEQLVVVPRAAVLGDQLRSGGSLGTGGL